MAKEMLVIHRCLLNKDGTIRVMKWDKFTAMLNPASFTHTHGISYSLSREQGSSAPELKFSQFKPDTLGFDIILDGTGVVPQQALGVKQQIDELKRITYNYNGGEHRPNVVYLLWGSFTFYGCLTGLKVEYTMFTPEGEPLRAKIRLDFDRYMSKQEESLRANKSSPDLTHVVEVKAGDTLPLLCYRIYKDCSYFPDIARINGLVNFRALEPGTKLVFPPLR